MSGISLLTFVMFNSMKASVDPLDGMDDWVAENPYGESRVEARDRSLHFLSEKLVADLNLSRLGLTSLPPGFLSMLKVVEKTLKLDLSENRFTEIPPEVYQLKNLEDLDLSKNHLKELPEGISGLKNLRQLDLSYNWSLKSLPKDIFFLPKECFVYLIGPGLNPLIQNEIIEKTDAEGYSGPGFVLDATPATLEKIEKMSQCPLLQAKL